MLGLLRVHHWSKNFLIFLPIFLVANFDKNYLINSLLGFILFSLACSATYVFNDIKDFEFDRRDPIKKNRYIASGNLSFKNAYYLFYFLIILSLICAFIFNPKFFLVLIIYTILSISYTLYLKKLLLIDVFVLAFLFILRLLAGGIINNIPISYWLFVFSLFFFISLALIKRITELKLLSQNNSQIINNRSYMTNDYHLIQIIALITGYFSILILSLYINSHDALSTFHNPKYLWVVCLALLYWISKLILLSNRGLVEQDLIRYILKDRSTIICTSISFISILISKFGINF